MSILLKYIIRFFKESKGRALLLILAIAVSGAMLYSMLAVKMDLEQTYRKQLTFSKGQADIQISAEETDNTMGIYQPLNLKLDNFTEEIQYKQNIVNTVGIYRYEDNKQKFFNLMGISLDEYLLGYNDSIYWAKRI